MGRKPKEQETRKDIDTLLAEAMVTVSLSKSEIRTLRFYLDKAIIDAEGSCAIGIGDRVSVKHLHAIRKKIAEKG